MKLTVLKIEYLKIDDVRGEERETRRKDFGLGVIRTNLICCSNKVKHAGSKMTERNQSSVADQCCWTLITHMTTLCEKKYSEAIV